MNMPLDALVMIYLDDFQDSKGRTIAATIDPILGEEINNDVLELCIKISKLRDGWDETKKGGE